jgi:hypothetical protein
VGLGRRARRVRPRRGIHRTPPPDSGGASPRAHRRSAKATTAGSSRRRSARRPISPQPAPMTRSFLSNRGGNPDGSLRTRKKPRQNPAIGGRPARLERDRTSGATGRSGGRRR